MQMVIYASEYEEADDSRTMSKLSQTFTKNKIDIFELRSPRNTLQFFGPELSIFGTYCQISIVSNEHHIIFLHVWKTFLFLVALLPSTDEYHKTVTSIKVLY